MLAEDVNQRIIQLRGVLHASHRKAARSGRGDELIIDSQRGGTTMTPQEQQLITELFARLKQTPAQAKDADAAQLIRKGVMENPDAPYLLVQTVLIQDMALSQAQHRVGELEQQLAEATAASSAQPSQPATSFLGGALARFLGGAPSHGSVPPASQPPAPPAAAVPGWHQSGANPTSFGGAAAPGMISSASSGFLRAAAATALGVAGGQLLFHGIQSMFGQHAGSILAGQSMQPALSETVVNNFYGDQASSPASTDFANAEASLGDAAVQDTRDDLTIADDDSDRDVSDQEVDIADTASDDSFDGDDTDLP